MLLVLGILWAPAASGAESSGADPPAPPSDVRAHDSPNDAGQSIGVTWTRSPDDGGGANTVSRYEIHGAENPAGPWQKFGQVPAGTTSYIDQARIEAGRMVHEVGDKTAYYYYSVRAVSPGGWHESVTAESGIAYPQ